jgi:hypothetical protein
VLQEKYESGFDRQRDGYRSNYPDRPLFSTYLQYINAVDTGQGAVKPRGETVFNSECGISGINGSWLRPRLLIETHVNIGGGSSQF